MYFDGSVMKMGAGMGLLFISPLEITYAIWYQALLSGLRIAIKVGVKLLDVRGDSQLVVDQVTKEASFHKEKMEVYYNAVRKLKNKFYSLELNHIVRKYNEEANELAKITLGRITVSPNIFARDLAKPSVDFSKTTPNLEEPLGAPSKSTGVQPMDEDP
jgi:hypothetical protein